MSIKKGDLYFADLSPVTGSEQGGITSRKNKADLPTHVEIEAGGNGLSKNSTVLMEQLRTIDKTRLKERIGTIDRNRLPEINEALSVSLGIQNDSFF